MRTLIAAFLIIICIPVLGMGQEFKINKFEPNTLIEAKKFNENFEYIENQIETLNKILIENKIPKGTVAAFNLLECPAGWSSFDKGAGRVIVGVGKGDGLEQRILTQTDGAETHTLTVDEMPKHSHRWLAYDFQDEYGGAGSEWHWSRDPDRRYKRTFQPVIEASGGGMAHNNMPPFIVLRFCQKN